MNRGRMKVEVEGRCRVCRTGPAHRLDAAHLIPRSLLSQGFDEPDAIVPLCSRIKGGAGCHDAYDAHELDLLPYLTEEEEVAAVRLAKRLTIRGSGIAQAYRLLSGDGDGGDLWT